MAWRCCFAKARRKRGTAAPVGEPTLDVVAAARRDYRSAAAAFWDSAALERRVPIQGQKVSVVLSAMPPPNARWFLRPARHLRSQYERRALARGPKDRRAMPRLRKARKASARTSTPSFASVCQRSLVGFAMCAQTLPVFDKEQRDPCRRGRRASPPQGFVGNTPTSWNERIGAIFDQAQ